MSWNRLDWVQSKCSRTRHHDSSRKRSCGACWIQEEIQEEITEPFIHTRQGHSALPFFIPAQRWHTVISVTFTKCNDLFSIVIVINHPLSENLSNGIRRRFLEGIEYSQNWLNAGHLPVKFPLTAHHPSDKPIGSNDIKSPILDRKVGEAILMKGPLSVHT